MFKTLIAKFPGTCKRCRTKFPAGTRIRYGGYGRTYHLKADCPAGGDAQEMPQSSLESSADAAGEWSVDARMAQWQGLRGRMM